MSTSYKAISFTLYFRSFLQHWVMTAFTQSTEMRKITPSLLEEKRRDYFSSSIISAFMGTQARVEQIYTFTHLMAVLLLFFFVTKKYIAAFIFGILHGVIISNFWISDLRTEKSLLKVIFQMHLFYKLVHFQIVLRILSISKYLLQQ